MKLKSAITHFPLKRLNRCDYKEIDSIKSFFYTVTGESAKKWVALVTTYLKIETLTLSGGGGIFFLLIK